MGAFNIGLGGEAGNSSKASLRTIIQANFKETTTGTGRPQGRRFPGRFDIDGAAAERDGGGLPLTQILLIGGAVLAFMLLKG